MKKLPGFFRNVALSALCLFLTSCSTSSPKTAGHPRKFHDEAAVNAVLQFSSWDYTFLVRPQYSENGFLQQVRRDNIGQVFDRLNVPRGTAVVLVGITYNGDVLNRLVVDWKSILSGCGFQRVVILRADGRNRLNGSAIIDDSTQNFSSVPGHSLGG